MGQKRRSKCCLVEPAIQVRKLTRTLFELDLRANREHNNRTREPQSQLHQLLLEFVLV